ncbi:MAG: hypothetical protein J5986_13325 [Roseburia sp.]|nr:hypothetical protein [Roseburia sp.]MBP3475442.1 hypothetical protein [Lachnospiraceae bacterium]
MYCSRLSVLQELLSEDKIEKLDKYFASLIGSACENITVSKVAKAIGVAPNISSKVLTKCMKEGLLRVSYAIRCPECNMLIKRVESLSEIPDEAFECYGCNEEIEVTTKDVEVLYSLTDNRVFINGQQVETKLPARTVVQEDSLESVFLAGGVNEYLFQLTDEQYQHLSDKYAKVKSRKGTTKKIGDTLENLVIELFNMCSVFNAAGIRTSTNQIDCCVRNKMCINYGVLNTLGSRFFIECKNENDTPSGGYLSKLHSIISVTNADAKEKCIRFGIIISKEKGPSTFKQLAVKYYLINKIIIISICGKELENLFSTKGNLLELIERKATEIMLDATTDLHEAGLYEI